MTRHRARAARALAVALVLALAAAGCGSGGGGDGRDEPAPVPVPTSGDAAPGGTEGAGPVPEVAVDGTLERDGERLAARLTVTNEGDAPVWVPDGYEGAPRSLLLPAAVGDGVVDLGWVVPPTPAGPDVPRLVLRRVAPGAAIDLASVDDPPPPEALVDTAGEPVEVVTSYRLCVDALANDAVPAEARDREAEGSTAVAAEALEGESTRTCGPSVPA